MILNRLDGPPIGEVDVVNAVADAALGNGIVAVLEWPTGVDDHGGLERFELRVDVMSHIKARRRC